VPSVSTLPGPRRALIVSASVGAGHDGAAAELAARLEAGGWQVTRQDFLDAVPLRIGVALRDGYEAELRHAPYLYELTYKFWYWLPFLAPLLARVVALATRRRVMRWIDHSGADVVVSTYPLSTQVLGRLRLYERSRWRRERALRIPTVNFVTDFGVHPLWVHRGIDLNLAVHPSAADAAARRSGRPSVAAGPLVAERFAHGRRRRAETRASLGLGPSDIAVLVTAGSWAVGSVRSTFDALTRQGNFVPVVVCGRDDALRAELERVASQEGHRAVIMGWTEHMPELMGACDALVENAGGLTSLEAMRAGLPVVSYQPIAGHGRANTRAMAAAGVSHLARDTDELIEALTVLGDHRSLERAQQLRYASAMFPSDAAPELEVAAASRAGAPSLGRRPPIAVAARLATGVAAFMGLAWAGVTTGVGVAAAAGAGVAHPVATAPSVAYVGIRLDHAELADPAVANLLAQTQATAVVDANTALADPNALRAMVSDGINVESGGHGIWVGVRGHRRDPAEWTRAQADARSTQVLQSIIGQPVTVVVPGRRVNAFDLVDTGDLHCSVVVPNMTVVAGDQDQGANRSLAAGHLSLQGKRIYLVDGLNASPQQLLTVVHELQLSAEHAHVVTAPLARLQ
jgi:processive 1,2-diacylglycerol beta-glucosyltransferase